MAYVGGTTSNANGRPVNNTRSLTAGNICVVIAGAFNATAANALTISDTRGNTLGSKIVLGNFGGAPGEVCAWVFQVTVGGAGTIAVSCPAGGTIDLVQVREYSGVTTTLDGTPTFTNNGGGTTSVTGSLTTANNGSQIIAGFYADGATSTPVPTWSAGWGNILSDFDGAGTDGSGADQVGNAGTYSATVTNNTSAQCNVILFALTAAGPTINTQPTSQTAYVGQTATFSVTATTSGGALSYQWKQNGSNVGTNSSSYTTGALALSDNGSTIQVVVTDSNGSATSASVTLTVINVGITAWFRA